MPADHWVNEDEGSFISVGITARMLPVGTAVERRIDTDWFVGTIADAYHEENLIFYDIDYRDDGNREMDVPASEVRMARANTSELERRPPVPEAAPPPPSAWDGPDLKAVSPVARVHGTAGDDDTTAFVVNGSTTKLGAGGGLHGIRFLRESVNMH